MSKRTQSIRSLFAAGNDEVQSSETRVPVQRVASGAVRSLKDTFSEVERDYEELKQRIAEGALPLDLDPLSVDPSPFADRFWDQDVAAIEALKASIKEHGQEMPILVRQHPTEPSRYQVAYGHRRLRVATELGISVKAYVRNLDDDRLVVAQGIENSAREDLSFIERATFANKLEAAGFQRPLIQSALSVDRAEVSKLIAVAQAIPEWIVTAIGRAPKIGRGRWQELADLLKVSRSESKARKATEEKSFGHKDSDDRFTAVVRALKKADKSESVPRVTPAVARSTAGAEIAKLSVSAKHCKIQISRDRDEAFAVFVMEQLPGLYESFKKVNPSSEG
ncbi:MULTISPECIES: plasmid partitioning protein RepB [Sinorhizobium]|uniref:Plasmid partitioning protein RepB n=1 Tax=Sinorhizobium americanum TaxID=194963 RepID=A0A2S3YUK4_9HYPH|nr:MULTISPECIES: plasmid partitioning protein RepB [Sinorhizobium]PDT39354.1 plasmid partitioning protein RepB [Sinorhizobium sp. FG01]PDT50709.1 plasmid partitioning protein RepB [Sinorhizobium sp. NG07B]POH34050.1 plasmid partitioning protein RepB [Sinorhizobium americanum]POH35285.1 plasmid partitioning protein RepB [Sinorhizobium americanum]